MTTDDLHERLELLRQGRAPLPLTPAQATAQAVRLRAKHHISYSKLARIMGEYHGVWLNEGGWRHRCRQAGISPEPRGIPFNGPWTGAR